MQQKLRSSKFSGKIQKINKVTKNVIKRPKMSNILDFSVPLRNANIFMYTIKALQTAPRVSSRLAGRQKTQKDWKYQVKHCKHEVTCPKTVMKHAKISKNSFFFSTLSIPKSLPIHSNTLQSLSRCPRSFLEAS